MDAHCGHCPRCHRQIFTSAWRGDGVQCWPCETRWERRLPVLLLILAWIASAAAGHWLGS